MIECTDSLMQYAVQSHQLPFPYLMGVENVVHAQHSKYSHYY